MVVLIVLLYVVMSLTFQGALAESVAALDRGQNHRFSSAFGAGVSNFWRVLGYFLLLVLISLGLLLAIGIPLALLVTVVLAGTAAAGARILTMVLAALVSFVLLLVVFVPFHRLAVRAAGGSAAPGGRYRLDRRRIPALSA